MSGSAGQARPSEENRLRSRLHLPFPRHDRTAFVGFDLKRCAACGECAAACPRQVLGIVAFLSHRHAHVDRAAACEGCRRCIAACSRGVVRARQSGRRTGITRATSRARRS